MKMNIAADDTVPDVLVVITDQSYARDLFDKGGFANTDALTLLEITSTRGGYAAFSGDLQDASGGVIGGCAPDMPTLIFLMSVIEDRLSRIMNEAQCSGWVVMVDVKDRDEILGHIKKNTIYH